MSPMADELGRIENCVHCGFCLPACPTYTRLGDEADSPRGRLHLMRAVAEGRLDPGAESFQLHIDRCLGCRACESVCPSGVDYGHLLERAREVAREARPPSLESRLLLAMVGSPLLLRGAMGCGRLLRLGGLAARVARLLPTTGPLASLGMAMAMLAASAPWDGLGRASETRGGSKVAEGSGRRATGAGPIAAGAALPGAWSSPRPSMGGPPSRRGRVALSPGCVQDQLFARVNAATVRVLEANGWEVVLLPSARCCGALHAHAGELGRARELALAQLDSFEASGADLLVANAAGCGAAIRAYGDLLEPLGPSLHERGERMGRAVRDLTVLLAGEGRAPREGGALPLRVAYDAPCHLLHGQRVSLPPVEVLRSIPGVELCALDGAEECCGGAGIYGLTHRELGGEIGRSKTAAIRRSGAEVVVTGNPGCIMQIGGTFLREGEVRGVVHPVELLDESYRRGGLYGGRQDD